MTTVAILGSTGMLGSTLTRFLEDKVDKIFEFNPAGQSITRKNEAKPFFISKQPINLKILEKIKVDYIVNCIGMIRQNIKEDDNDSTELAYRLNYHFPLELQKFVSSNRIPLIQIATDCVYSGMSGNYTENSKHDPIDLYGLTKSLGEEALTSSMLLRCSIIGREFKGNKSLLEWLVSRPKNYNVRGYTNHLWNGLTTLHFAQIVNGIIATNSYEEGLQHLIPQGVVSKYELLRLLARYFDRNDLRISEHKTEKSVNLQLTTNKPKQNLQFWSQGGYNLVPTIEEMISIYAKWLDTNG